jgi:hypothetical protein
MYTVKLRPKHQKTLADMTPANVEDRIQDAMHMMRHWEKQKSQRERQALWAELWSALRIKR